MAQAQGLDARDATDLEDDETLTAQRMKGMGDFR